MFLGLETRRDQGSKISKTTTRRSCYNNNINWNNNRSRKLIINTNVICCYSWSNHSNIKWDIKTYPKNLHTTKVENTILSYVDNKVESDKPPPLKVSEEILSRKTRTTLSQLHSGHWHLLINWPLSPLWWPYLIGAQAITRVCCRTLMVAKFSQQ